MHEMFMVAHSSCFGLYKGHLWLARLADSTIFRWDFFLYLPYSVRPVELNFKLSAIADVPLVTSHVIQFIYLYLWNSIQV